jgi:hypothetical protein
MFGGKKDREREMGEKVQWKDIGKLVPGPMVRYRNWRRTKMNTKRKADRNRNI